MPDRTVIVDPADPRLGSFRDLLTRRPDPAVFFAESEVAVARLLASPHFHTHAVLGTAPHLARLAARTASCCKPTTPCSAPSSASTSTAA
ncbi:hypothetical protein [Nannocystis sp.]|uniref:hypothetical protein n=1 Tax=Nannocystis sp. TaxID=1962667 RepID=UPI0025EC7889|nr:hypothetical protein [Nannocystis sp.]MBK7825334.1 hypothetical protein [Nannocystis sp.]